MPPRTKEGSAELADAIKRRRCELGLSAEEAARRAGVGAKTWFRYESGSSIRSDKVKGICRALSWSALPVQEGVAKGVGEEYAWLESIDDSHEAWSPWLVETFGRKAAVSFAVGSDILLDYLNEDLSGLSKMPSGTHLGELSCSWLADCLPQQFLTQYTYQFVYRLRTVLAQYRIRARFGHEMCAHSPAEELLVRQIRDFSFDAIEEWMRDLLTGMVTSNLTTMFTDVNEKTGEIATQVGMTPQGWNSSIYNMVQSLSNSVIVPIAGIIITMVLCYELISMLTERNNLHDVDTWMFFKYFFKMWVAVFLVSNTWTITMAVFDVGQSVVNSAAGTISGSTTIDISSFTSTINTTMESMELGELFVLMLETFILSFCMKVMSVLIMVIMFGRMIEIYLYTSVAPIPFATMSNREWGQMGTNYFRGLFALAFQAFLMMVCVGIYAALVASIELTDNVHSALFGVAAYTIILCFSLLKTGSLSKQIFNTH